MTAKKMDRNELDAIVSQGSSVMNDRAINAMLYPNIIGMKIDITTEDGDLMASVPATLIRFALKDGSFEQMMRSYLRLRSSSIDVGKTIGRETAQLEMRRALGMPS